MGRSKSDIYRTLFLVNCGGCWLAHHLSRTAATIGVIFLSAMGENLTTYLISPIFILLFSAVLAVECDPSTRFRTLDGTCNNPAHPTRGSAGTTILLPPSRRSVSQSRSNPSARNVSNSLMATWWSAPSEHFTDLFTYFAQFVDHDLVRFAKPGSTAQSLPIEVPNNDDDFTRSHLPFRRLATVETPDGPSPKNLLSSFLDASAVYGTSESRLEDLRNNSDSCCLRTGPDNFLPQRVSGVFLAGDTRVNENTILAAMHTLWMREHNSLCGELAAAFPRWDGKERFNMARKILGALLQAVTYNEWLPPMIGESAMPEYSSFNASVDPRISLLFAGASFRVGHILVNDVIVTRNIDGNEQRLGIEKTLFAPRLLETLGMTDVFRGAITNRAKKLDLHVVHALRSLLITAKDGDRLDLASINIQRGRDLQLPSYNDARSHYGLAPAKTFADITDNINVETTLRMLYGHVDNVEAWVGGLAEAPQNGMVMGPLFTASWVDDFRRIRDGDSFFYRRPGLFDEEVVEGIPILKLALDVSRQKGVMKEILARNTELKREEIPDNPFVPHES